MPRSDSHVRRHFGYVQICWKVKHFWLLSCRKNWEISSPAFDVHSTRWRLLLRAMSRDESHRHMCAYLERLASDDGPDVVRAHWKVRMCNCKRRNSCLCYLLREKEELFHRGDRRLGEVLENMECLNSDFEPFESDDLVIECKLLVYDPEMSSEEWWWSEVNEEGLRSLSADLRDMFRKGDFSDMVIKIGVMDVKASRAILCVRNVTLAKIINRDISTTAIQFPAYNRCPSDAHYNISRPVNADAVWRFVGYLHYGRLDEVVFGHPSLSVAECARILNEPEVSAHYVPEMLTLKTRLDVEEHVVTWFVTKFQEGNVCPIVSPTLIQNSSEEDRIAWRLVLYPRGKEGTGDHAAIYAEASGGWEKAGSKLACLEFAVVFGEQNLRHYRRLQKPPGETFEGLGVDDFLECPLEWEIGTLRVKFRLRMSDDAPKLLKVHNHAMSVAAFPGGGLEHIQRLSIDLAYLLWKDSVYCDFTIRCYGGYAFHVHRSIIAARARSFSALAGTSSELDLGPLHATSPVVSVLLSYIYSGQLQADEEVLADDLLMLAEYLGVDALVRTCSRIVKDREIFVPRGLPSSQGD